MTPLNQRRLAIFRSHRRGWWSLWIFLTLFIICLFAEFVANDRPLIIRYENHWFVPVPAGLQRGRLRPRLPPHRSRLHRPRPDAGDPRQRLDDLARHTLLLRHHREKPPLQPPNSPILAQPPRHRRPIPRRPSPRHLWLPYLPSSSVSALTIISSILGIAAGAVQGYYGGLTDLLFQRFIEIWSGMPQLFLLIILASVITPGFWVLLALPAGILLDGAHRRGARRVPARAQPGLRARRPRPRRQQHRHHVASHPAQRPGRDHDLPAVHLVRFGHRARQPGFLPRLRPAAGFALAGRIGEPWARDNLQSPWLGITAFCVQGGILVLLIFIGEATRDAFDPRKQLL